MTELAFQFETDPQMGIPRLSSIAGTATVWTASDVQQMEDQLRTRYESLVRDGQGTLQFKGNTLHIKKKDGDTTRQPTLEVRVPPAAIVRNATKVPASNPIAALVPARSATDWYAGWLKEIEPLFSSECVRPAETAMLQVVWTELHGLPGKTSLRELGLLLSVAVLSLADQLSRTHQPGQPHPFPFALSGLKRLLDSETRTPWGSLPTTLNSEPPPSWFSRFWNLLKGE